MFNNSNLFGNSQLSNISPEHKKIIDTLYRCSEPELFVIRYARTVGRGIDSGDVIRYLQYSDSAASSILRRLADPKYNKRLISPLLNRDKCGARGAWLYFINEEVKLEDVEKIIQEQRYNYQRFIDNQIKKNSKNDGNTNQDQNREISTHAPITSTQINHQEQEKPQEEKIELSVSELNDVKNQAFNLTDYSELNENEFPFLFSILRKEIAEKDKQLQQLKTEYERVVASLIKQKTG